MSVRCEGIPRHINAGGGLNLVHADAERPFLLFRAKVLDTQLRTQESCCFGEL